MVKKIFGVIFLLAGIGNFMGNFAKSQVGRNDAGADIIYGLVFIGLGIALLLWNKKKEEPTENK